MKNITSVACPVDDLIGILAATLPDQFLGKCLDQLSNGILRWRTIQNMRSRKEIPAECFVKISSRKVAILREPFLKWFASTIPTLND